MFNNTTTTFGSGAVVPTPAATIPTAFPSTTVTSNSTFIIIGPPPPFPASPRSIDFSPLKLIFAVIAIIAVPALAYALFFAYPCSSSRRHRNTTSSSTSQDSSPPQVIIELPPPATTDHGGGGGDNDSGVKFQKNTHSKEIGNECTVCLSVFTDGEEIRQLSACKHAFHVACIEMWLKDHPNCPICRADVSVKQTETTVNVNGNVNRGGGGGNRRVSATSRDDDWRQGLPDSSGLL